jgi:hypothetical protein
LSYAYHLSFEEIAAMPTAAIWAYLERLPAREAETELRAIEAALLPHVKDRDRAKVIRRLERQATRDEEKPPVTKAQFAANLAMVGIGFRVKPPRESSVANVC